MEYRQAFQNLNMPPARYVARYALPMVGGGVVASVLALTLLGSALPPWLTPLVPVLVVGFAVALALLWPLAATDRKRGQIDHAMPFFMTHFGALSTSNMSRTEIFRVLGGKKEYRALADELNKIHSLVVNWNLSLPQAARFVSRTTPSQIFGDFLERLAHALETGQDLETFLRGEQSVVMKEYATVYETSLYQIEQWKDVYSSVIMSGVFFVIFAIISPILTEINPTKLFQGIIVFFVLMEVLLLFVLKLRVPHDRLWHQLDIPTEERSRIRYLLFGATALSLALLVLVPRVAPVSVGLSIAIGVTPFAFTGFFARRVENRIKRREDNYAAFVRSLGASAAARGGSLREVLRKVKMHNFGPLTTLVNHLYARLTWRLHDAFAWRRFSAESGSYLVEEFNDMFVEGIRSGGKAEAVGSIISENVVRILNLRKSRYSQAGTFRGLLIGLTASMSFVLFTGVALLGVLKTMFSKTVPDVGELNPVNFNFEVDVGGIQSLLLWLVLFHCLVAALMLKMVDGGGYPAGLGTFVLMVWIGVGLAAVSGALMENIFHVGAGS